ncbi:hypothetical protein QA639_40290 [Bradyrhizobium pachyrhizi]|uniref:hypothetical protein n=1 Tax=Bradyrhizobium pachyrhizi TaxID=280333 RepID=UPI0024B204E8|nr:hypothetical protein [Bradyrhizobium pachyrhizi]WFU55711.1 hypothetical protein QA639_40290 [Bradyrhizobium pachyrhizi]
MRCEITSTSIAHDELVPDTVVASEFHKSLMTLYRWTHDPTLDFPPPIKIRNRNHRSRRGLEEFKARMMLAGITQRAENK